MTRSALMSSAERSIVLDFPELVAKYLSVDTQIWYWMKSKAACMLRMVEYGEIRKGYEDIKFILCGKYLQLQF